jgi:hypothetical protein
MGGCGSGRRYKAKAQAEYCVILASSWMLQKNYLDLGVGWTKYHPISWINSRNEPVYNMTLGLERLSISEIWLNLSDPQQVIYLHTTPCGFGGVRWWFGCPRCGRRCGKLYLRKGSVFLCRICHDLTYESCIDGKSMNTFLAERGAKLGLSAAEVKQEIAEDTRARNKWRRKRDRRASYKGRGGCLRAVQEKSLKLKMLEAKVMNDIIKLERKR